jgi:pimeloyl-ACP methyl ester carboxylesterase
MKWKIALGAAAGLAVLAGAVLMGADAPDGDRASGPVAVARQGFFYAGGREITQGNQKNLVDAMFVEYQIPAKITAPYPMVMVHGHYQNGSNFLATPDDREGWAEFFLRRGYPVYVVDQPARGRSTYTAASDGPLTLPPAETLERQFTAPEHFNIWPQAHLHTQWPGTGMAGDPTFEQFRASQNPSMTDDLEMDVINRAALGALLRRIGPAIVMTHSRSGTFGWEVADDFPELVKAVIAAEPNGPPFYNVVPTAMGEPVLARRWGLAYDHLTYDPPVSELADLAPRREEQSRGASLMRCWVAGTPHQLPHLAGIPVMIVTAEASYHAAYDHCTSEYLTRAGVSNDLFLLGEHGIHGNGHMMMIEKNNLQIAGLIADWVNQHVKTAKPPASAATKKTKTR